MGAAGTTVDVELGFLPERHAVPDPDHPGLRRAGSRAAAPYGDDRVEFHRSRATDLSAGAVELPDLRTHGVDTVDLSGLAELQAACRRTAAAGRVAEGDAAVVRRALEGAVLPCASGQSVEVRFLAGEGFFMRSVGPARTPVVGPHADGMNEHGGASSVHADQDVYGTPLVQLMDGRAPELFHHDSPDGHNHDAPLMLVNLWIPLQQVVQPLVLADGRSIDRRRHQLRYGLATSSFLDRDEEMEVNDIWAFLHDDGQEWFFRSDMDHRSAWVFNTLSTPHGSGVVPGEDLAARRRAALVAAVEAVGRDDLDAASAAVEGCAGQVAPVGTPPPLQAALALMADLCGSVPSGAAGPGAAGEWAAAARAACDAVVRRSLELRLVVAVVG